MEYPAALIKLKIDKIILLESELRILRRTIREQLFSERLLNNLQREEWRAEHSIKM